MQSRTVNVNFYVTSIVPVLGFSVNTQPSFVEELPSNITFDLSGKTSIDRVVSLGSIADLEEDSFTVEVPSEADLGGFLTVAFSQES